MRPSGRTMTWLTKALREGRDATLGAWLAAVRAQPFHRGRPAAAVSDDIPRLYDAVLTLLEREEESGRSDAASPFDDPAIVAAARDHARARAEQGLQPADVVVEFRLLRREVRHALRTALPDDAPPGRAAASELAIVDAYDGAIAVGLAAFTSHAEEVREEFLAATVHDVRQPLTTIRGNAQLGTRLLRRGAPDLERLRAVLAAITAETAQMSALLESLSDVSHASLGRLALAPEPTDLGMLVAALVEQLDPAIGSRVQLTVAPGADLGGVWDRVRLREVVTNLLANAAKYAPDETPIELSLAAHGGGVRLTVRDRGLGIAPEELPMLFRRYARAPTAQARGISGRGLGLYLCRAIVEAHGGRIWAESAGLDQGTTVQVTLPREAPQPPAAP